ncbi:MAG: hypothetical protein R3A47_12160 [Polyangiales bacterium]
MLKKNYLRWLLALTLISGCGDDGSGTNNNNDDDTTLAPVDAERSPTRRSVRRFW